MGEALFEMEHVLRSQKGSLTANEENLLQRCKSRAVREFTSGVLVGAGGAWAGNLKFFLATELRVLLVSTVFLIISSILAATWKLSRFARANISGGAAALFGFWRFGKALDSCVDHILAMDGSRMQKELAHILATKYQDDPWTSQQLNKRFYPENVYDDSNSDRPIIRLRYRNFYGDNVSLGERVHDSDSLDVSHNDSVSDSKKADMESRQVPMNPGANIIEDPLESSFGSMAPVEEIHHPTTSGTPARVLTHSHRRSRRRRRMHHHKASLDREHDQQQQV